MKARKKLVVAMALMLASSGSAWALGLGQIKVKSALNEPLLAVIPVVSASAEELQGLKVTLASSEAYQRAGINRARLRIDLKFKVEKRAGRTVIVVTSEEAVSDPVLDLLLALHWSNGKLLREYALLLDPPGMPMPAPRVKQQPAATTAAAAEPQPVAEPEALERPAETAESSQAEVAQPAAPTEDAASTASAAADDAAAPAMAGAAIGPSYTTQAGDTLWDVAEHAMDDDGNINRMMVAIQRSNPDAFYQDNINALKKGAVLRLPNREQLAAVSASEATQAVRRQNESWAGIQAKSPTTMTGTPTFASMSGDVSGADDSAGRLQLLPPGEDETSGAGRAGQTGGSGSAAVAGVKQDLARAREALASQKQRADEMHSRVQDLEGILDKNQRLLELKNAQIAALQSKLAAAGSVETAATAVPATAGSVDAVRDDIFQAGEVASAASAAAPAGAATVAGAGLPAAASSVADASATTPAEVSGAALEVPGSMAATADTATPADQSGVDTRAAESAAPVQVENQPEAAQKPWYMRTWTWIVAAVVIVLLLLFGFLRGRGKKTDDTVLDDGTEGDALGIAEGDEEEQALLDQVAESPDDMEAHLELASLYYAYRDQDKFVDAAEAMHAHVDDPELAEWQHVQSMGEELCPDHPLFASSADATETVEMGEPVPPALPSDEPADDVSLADMVDHGDAHGEDQEHGGDGKGYNFDFDLTGGEDRPGDAERDAPAATDDPLPASDTDRDQGADEDPLGLDSLFGTAAADTDEGRDTPTREDPPEGIDSRHVDDADDELAVSNDDILDDDLAGTASDPDDDLEEAGSDPVDTKLDLARAYQDMGDADGARDMLEEVLQEGSEAQKDMARKLLDEL